MKLIPLAFLLALTCTSFAEACPDLSGTYLQKLSSCRGDFKSHRGWPLQEHATVVTIVQEKCNSLTISYPETKFSNAPVFTVFMNFADAIKFSSDDNSISAKFFEPSSRASGMFGTIKASIAEKVKFELEGTSLRIDSSSMMKGFINYVIPVLDKDSFSCQIDKI
jgi:hypothetical protein